MEDIKIYICTHKDFQQLVTNACYQVIDSRNITPNLPLKDDFYSEFYQFKWISEQPNLPEYIGFCHYRRYFSFLDDIPHMTPNKLVVTTPMFFNVTVEQQYAYHHNVGDLDLVGDIIKEKFPDYYDTWQHFIKGKTFYPNNMFIMHKDKFKKYCHFIFTILDEYLKRVGTDIHKHIEENKDKYIKVFSPNNTTDYQYRIGGYVGERLSNVFFNKNFGMKEIYDRVITEKKY